MNPIVFFKCYITIFILGFNWSTMFNMYRKYNWICTVTTVLIPIVAIMNDRLTYKLEQIGRNVAHPYGREYITIS